METMASTLMPMGPPGLILASGVVSGGRCPSMARLLRFIGLVVLCALLGGCGDDDHRVPALKLRHTTAIERRASLSMLRRAWAERPGTVSVGAGLHERALLNRTAWFGRKVKDTETYRAACDFWMACVRDHIARYEDDAGRYGK